MVYNAQRLGDDKIILLVFYIVVELAYFKCEPYMPLKMIKPFKHYDEHYGFMMLHAHIFNRIV